MRAIEYCKKCGKYLQNNSMICEECGTKVVYVKKGYNEEFSYLETYEIIYDLMCQVDDRMDMKDYDVAAQKMRSVAEAMSRYLHEKNGGEVSSSFYLSFNEILNDLKISKILPESSLSNYRFIKDKGNIVSHGQSIDANNVKLMYNILKHETKLFADKYVYINKKLKTNKKGKNDENYESSFFIRLMGVFVVSFACYWMKSVYSMNTGIWPFGFIFVIVGIHMIITGKRIK